MRARRLRGLALSTTMVAIATAIACGSGGGSSTGQTSNGAGAAAGAGGSGVGGTSSVGAGGSVGLGGMASAGSAGSGIAGAGVAGTTSNGGSAGFSGMPIDLPPGPTCADRPLTVATPCAEDTSFEMCLQGYVATITEPCGKCTCAGALLTFDDAGCVVAVSVSPPSPLSDSLTKCLLEHVTTERWGPPGNPEMVMVTLGGCHPC